ncbi:MAG TPA: Ig-like domain-containing protein [Verrucomicrobiota bacterium]|nr:Ig-like domain-containing protein [Verrucomicrobiota bacterium]HQL79745.1 Ig-like domain-containing protein [Verrucomicrobiota bacterium]
MKTRLFTFALATLLSAGLLADTDADRLIRQGRGLLVQQDLWGAKARFEEALNSTNHPDANALLAVTRLLTLEKTPAGEAILDKLGFSAGGRTIYNWQSEPPRDTNGIPFAPASLSAAELSAFWRASVLPAMGASETDLSKITNTNYTLMLSSAETASEGIEVDYGDILLARAMLWFAQYASYTVCSWDLDFLLSELSAAFRERSATVESMLAAHPNILMIANTNDLAAARQAFVKAVELYLQASDFIRTRTQNTVRFFNYDLEMADGEAMFRQTLIDLTNSLTAPVVLAADTNLTVYLAPHFAGQTPSRSFVPRFHENQLVLGSLPDKTFGGVVEGLAQGEIEEWLADIFGAVIPLSGTIQANPRRFEIRFPTLPQHGYVLQCSADLLNWTDLAEFVALGESYTNTDFAVNNSAERFYRLAELSDLIIVSGQAVSRCSGQALAGAVISTSLDGRTAVTDAQGLFSLQTRLGTNGYLFEVYAQAANHLPYATTIYWDGQLASLVMGLMPAGMSVPPNDQFASRIILPGFPAPTPGTTCGATWQTCEPEYSGGVVWWTWTSPYNATVWVRALPANGSSYEPVEVFTGSSLCSLTNRGSWFNAVAGEEYQIAVGSWSAEAQGSFTLEIIAEPVLSLTWPTDGSEWTAPANIQIQADFQSFNGPLKEVEIYANSELIYAATNGPASFLWGNVPPGGYWVEVEAEDSIGQWTYDWAYIWVRPQNDDFASRIVLTGTSVIAAGDNTAATRETGEPYHANTASGSSSVWWAWSAPTNGPVTVSAFGDEHNSGNADFLGIYTGNSVSSLTLVASNAFGIPGYGSQTTFAANMGTTYYIAVDGTEPEGGPLQLRLQMSPMPHLMLLSPTNGQVIEAGAAMALIAAVANSNSLIHNVAFMDETGVLGYDSTAPYSLESLAPLAPGLHTLQASALDVLGLISYSEIVTVEVVPTIATNLILRITRDASLPVIGIAGQIGSQVVLEYVTEVPAGTNWQTLTSLSLTNSPQFYTDASAGSASQRFYRARLLP